VWDFFRQTRKLANSIKLVVDISSTFKLKIKALHAYQTQFIQMSIPYVEVYINSFFNGLKYGYKFAEVFIREK
jgi:LmbE family N-acetylglucosaminyl deacetylase